MDQISFKLSDEQTKAIQLLSGDKGIRVSGFMKDGKIVIDFLSVGSGVVALSATPFDKPEMAPFIACNGPLPT